METAEDVRNKMNDREHAAILLALQELKGSMVSQSEFQPVKRVVYAMVGAVLLFALGQALIGIVAAAENWDAIVAMI